MAINSNKFLTDLKNYAKSEHLDSDNSYLENNERLTTAALELADKSKSILGGLYYDFRKADNSFMRKVKNLIIAKIANIVRNTLERPLLTQQKFNQQSYFLIAELYKENKLLRTELTKLKTAPKS